MRRIKKDIRLTTIKATEIEKGENGELVSNDLQDISLYGETGSKMTKQKANAIVTKQYGDGNYIIDVHEVTQTYVMSAEDFIKYGTLLEDKEQDK